MCGRYACSLCPSELRSRLKESNLDTSEEWRDESFFQPSYNVAPRKWVPVVRRGHEGELIVQTMRWGFIPTWAKQMPDNQPINARDDTLTDRSSVFDHAKNKGRCIVVAEGFYEWKKLGGGKKIPHYTKRKDGKLMLFAGLYDVSHIEEDKPMYTCTIITTSASSFFSSIHDRMPVILENGSPDVDRWLSEELWSKEHAAILKPYEGELDCYQVTEAVGPTTNNSPDFVVPVDRLKGSISNFFKKAQPQDSTKIKDLPLSRQTKRRMQEEERPEMQQDKKKRATENAVKKETGNSASQGTEKITSFFGKK